MTSAAFTQDRPKLQLMPVPSRIEIGSGALRIDAGFLIRQNGKADNRVDRAIQRIYQRLTLKLALPIPPVKLPSQTPRILEIECAGPGSKIQQAREDESYDLEVRADGAKLKAANPLGVMHGLETFYQLVSVGADNYGTVPAVTIQDQPRFPWRGLLLDVSRHFLPIPQIERTIDGLAAVKMNVLHLHLSDDQGFRAAAEHAPELAEKGSRGQYYSKAELKGLVEYARDRGVRIVPEFDMPGHTTAWLASHPELATVTGKTYEPATAYGILEDVLDPTNPKLFALLDKLIGDMTEIFPDEYFHIGGDEVVYKQWNASPALAEFRKQHNLADGKALQAWFNTEVAKIVKKHHRRMVGWNEILRGEIPQDTVIQDWVGVDALQESVRRKFDVIISLGYYLDWLMPAWYHYGIDPLRPDPASADKLIANSNFDEFQKLRADQQQAINLPEGSEKYVLGGEAAEWTELVGPWAIEAVIWPRLGAIAERFWSPAETRDLDDLYRRFPALNAELADLGIRVMDSLQAMRLHATNTIEDLNTLNTLAETLEPIKYYGRNDSKSPDFNTLGPYNRLADMLPPESLTATNLHFAVNRYVAAKNADDLNLIRRTLQRWSNNRQASESLVSRNARLKDAAPLLESLNVALTTAQQALDFIDRGERPPADWVSAQTTMLNGMQPAGEVRLAILDSVRKLVDATSK